MVAKYFVWGLGAWRELDVSTGGVRGWRRRARFVFVRRGRLQLARRGRVLRALRALAADQPSAAADGPRLAHLRKQTRRPSPAPPAPAPAPLAPLAPPPPPPLHHCCAHYNGCGSSHAHVSVQREAGVQCGAAGGVTLSLQRPAHSSGEEPAAPRPRPGPRRSKSRSAQLRADTTALLRPQPVQDVSEPKRGTEEMTVDSKEDEARPPRSKRPRLSSSSEEAGELCKELVISEEDLAALRGFVAHSRSAALERFDTDERYRRALCYAINPLVTLRRCDLLQRLQQLQAASRPHADTDADKENKEVPQASTNQEARRKPRPDVKQRIEKLRRSLRGEQNSTTTVLTKQASPTRAQPTKSASQTKVPLKTGSPAKASPTKSAPPTKVPPTTGSPKKAPPTKPVTSTKDPLKTLPTKAPSPFTKPASPTKVKAAGAHAAISNRPSGHRSKEYSSLEDHCIVSWLESGDRASQVNGNRLWQELQPQYPRLTGQDRSWHSLRNRYLRYILPALGALGLPPAHVSRLRAAAATGCMKHGSRPATARRASIFKHDAVRSASARRPRPPGPDRTAGTGPAASLPEAKDDGKLDSSASRVTRSSRGPPERASPPPSDRDRPSTSKASDQRASPRVGSRGDLPSKMERSSSRSSRGDHSGKKKSSPPRGSRGDPPSKVESSSSGSSRGDSSGKKKSSLPRGSRGDAPNKMESSPPRGSRGDAPNKMESSPPRGSKARPQGKRERSSSSSSTGDPPDKKESSQSRGSRSRRPGKRMSSSSRGSGGDLPGKRERSRGRAPGKRETPDSPYSSSSSDDEGGSTPPRRGRGRPPHPRESDSTSVSSTSSSEQESSANVTDDKLSVAPRRSLRYSDVTRRFAARQRRSAVSYTSDTSDARPERADASDERPTRSRKLFNPNAKL